MIAREGGGSDFKTVEPGTYMARCYKLIDLGTQAGEYEGKPISKREIVIGWEFPAELMDDGKPYVTSAFYTLSLSDKARLRPLLVSWRGRDFTPEELGGFDIKNILGAACMLSMTANKKGKSVVSNASALMKGMKCPVQMNDSVYFSLDPAEFSQEVFSGLGEFFQKKIVLSPEYDALFKETPVIQRNDAPVEDGDIPF